MNRSNEMDAITQTEELIVETLPGVTKVEIEKVWIEPPEWFGKDFSRFSQWRIYVEIQPTGYPSLCITEFESLLDAEAQEKIAAHLKAAWENYKEKTK